MNLAALATLCALHAQTPSTPLPPGAICPPVARQWESIRPDLRRQIGPAEAREGIARVAYAEAGDQGDSGLAGVVYTILNRLQDGRWGGDVNAVLNAPHQFEPVTRAGGDWRRLRQVSEAQRAHIETILNLALDGRLPDLTGGARYFQNPRVVAARARGGSVAPSLVNFGGATPSAVIGAHSFYADVNREGEGARSFPAHLQAQRFGPEQIFVGENRSSSPGAADPLAAAEHAPPMMPPPPFSASRAQPVEPDPHAIFVSNDAATTGSTH